MRQIVLLVLFFSLIGCNSDKHADNKTIPVENIVTKEITNMFFQEFLNKLPLRQLPIHFSCGLPDGPDNDNLRITDFRQFSELIPDEFSDIYGVLNSHTIFKVIIYGMAGDDIYPTLFTYDQKGKIIDSLFLIINPCGGADDTQIPHSYVTINSDLSIALVDTSKFIHYPDQFEDYVVDSIIVTKVNYQINKNGLIIKQ